MKIFILTISILLTLLHTLSVIPFCFYFIIKRWSSGSLLVFLTLMLTVNFPLKASEKTVEDELLAVEEASLGNDYYVGVSIVYGKGQHEITDIQGFANWGNPGSIDYDSDEPGFNVLVGKKININGVPLRIELDGTFGGISASTDRLDPVGLDETAKTDIPWILTARAGVEKELGPVTVFANGGVAVARVSNSVIDIDFEPGKPPWKDPDDSFYDDSTRIGWVIGVGTEVPLNDSWTLRVDGSYIDLGGKLYKVNRSGGNRCGPEGPYSPCSYKVKNKVGTIRLAIIRRFSIP